MNDLERQISNYVIKKNHDEYINYLFNEICDLIDGGKLKYKVTVGAGDLHHHFFKREVVNYDFVFNKNNNLITEFAKDCLLQYHMDIYRYPERESIEVRLSSRDEFVDLIKEGVTGDKLKFLISKIEKLIKYCDDKETLNRL
jgi:hypothetical protein